MKRLALPAFNAQTTVQACAAGISLQDRAQLLLNALAEIQLSEVEYRELGPVGELYRIMGTAFVTPQLDAEMMTRIYNRHFVRKGSPSRHLYEQIRMAPEFGICPLCAQRTVAAVDHFLPQSRYPRLVLTPANLIPACSDCNKNKSASAPLRPEDQTLHPYFDDLGTERWLIVEVLPSAPPTISFSVRPSAQWSAILVARVHHHFRTMGLSELYAAQAASEMADISYSLEEVGRASGAQGVRQHLDGQFHSRQDRDPNSWKTALYQGLRDSEWFCQDGYKLIRTRSV